MKSALCSLVFWIALSFPSVISPQEVPGSAPFTTGMRTVTGSVALQGMPISNVRITIESLTRSFHRVLYADSSGNFVISNVPVGQYNITLEADGFRTVRETLDVPRGSGVVTAQFMMRPIQAAEQQTSKGAVVSVQTLQIPQGALRELAAGLREMERTRWKQARQHFEKALQKHPAFPQALHALALVDLREQHTEPALEWLRRAVDVDPGFAEGHLTLSRLLNSLGRSQEALGAAERCVELQPNGWEGHYELGLAALSLGQDGLALEASQHIERLAGSKRAEAALLRAGVLLKRGQLAEAKAALESFLESAPGHRHADLARRTLAEIERQLSFLPKP